MHALWKKLPRRTRTRAFRGAVAVGLAAWVIAGVLTLGRRTVVQLLQPEFLVYLALLLAAALLSGVRRFVGRLPQPHRWGYGLLLVGLLSGQIAGEDRAMFPFVRWHMYSRPLDATDITVTRYAGVTSQGERVLLNPSTLYPSLGNGTLRLHNRLELLSRAAVEMRDTPQAGEIEHRLKSMLRALAQKHNQSAAAGEAVHHVELWQATLNLQQQAPVPQWRKTHSYKVHDHAIAAR